MAFEVTISEEVFSALNTIAFYLEKRWSKKVAENFLNIFYNKVNTISNNPAIGRKSTTNPSIRKILITKHNLLYYQVTDNRIECLTIFFTMQDPGKISLIDLSPSQTCSAHASHFPKDHSRMNFHR